MRDVLVAVCGLTPQVVTETLWALHHHTPPIHPAEIWILTTRAGQNACRHKLFGPTGALAAYLREYGKTPGSLRYGPRQLIVLKGADGTSLDDVRSDADNLAVADQIAEFIRQQAERPDIRLHCSVAGGRKTMGVLLASALQLFGREDDRLYHVLVPPEIERQADFFYPTRPSQRSSRTAAAGAAPIELADVPFVRLRSLLAPETLAAGVRFSDLVGRAERELRALTNPNRLRITRLGSSHPRIMIGDAVVEVRPAAARLYTAFARIKADHCKRRDLPVCGSCVECYIEIASDKWDRARAVLEPLSGAGKLPPSVEPARSLISKANRALAKALASPRVAQRYAIRSVGERTEKRYGLAADKTLITIES
jgi:CRISPR-associated protein (TIGR02584 family)